MMMNEVVERAWMTYDVFLNGFALVQVMPGPLFNLAPFVGAAMLGLPGALIAAVGMFAPGVSLIFAVLPFWADFRKTKLIKVCLSGVTAGKPRSQTINDEQDCSAAPDLFSLLTQLPV